ncbi:MAG TPA: hypothetical protein DCX53_16200, partial [Anaerolineae bacterium]|nr:hypothetical protein [Anaerolineae bacterium]
ATLDPAVTPIPTSTVAPPTPTSVPEDVTPTATPFTVEGFNTEYQATVDEYKTYGISETTLRSAYRNDLLRNKLLEAITADIPTTAEQVWARHILVENPSLAGTVSLILAQGGDFATAAKKYSIDTGSGAEGGDLGWFGPGAMVPEFETAAFNQPIGEIGKPVQSQFGYHIIQVLDRRELPLPASALEQNRNTAFSDWLTTSKSEAAIITNDTWMQHIPKMPAFGAQ